MKILSRTALFAVFSLATATVIGGTGAATALVPDQEQGLLLPQSVRDAAQDESIRTADYTIVPGADAQPDQSYDRPSLSALVAQRADSDPATREEDCLATAVYFEARSEPLEGQLAVAQVLLNRAGSGRFPATLCGVVFQRGQFSFVRGNAFPAISRSSRDWREAVAIARIAQAGQWESGAQRALYFHAARVSPGWHLARVAAIGNHVFYR